jgi:hypothetical protein
MNHHPHPGIFMGYLWDTVFMRFLYGISMELWNMSSIFMLYSFQFPRNRWCKPFPNLPHWWYKLFPKLPHGGINLSQVAKWMV